MRKLILLISALLCLIASAQEKDKPLRAGNEMFTEKDFASAEAQYRISKSRFSQKATSAYNLGNSIYRQNQPSEAKSAYIDAVQKAQTRPQKHYAYHNLGNVFMKEKKYAEAVEAFKNALRNNPSDEETRYNYALAKKMLKENPPKDDKKDKKDDKKDDKIDKKDDKKKDDKKDDPKEDQKDKGQNPPQDPKQPDNKPKPDDQGQPKPQEGGISKQRLESLLDAVNNEEKKIQDKVNVKKVKAAPKRNEKDW